MKIVVCGGHHNSALVVAEKLNEKGHQLFWLGHKYSMIGDQNPSAEFLEVTKKGIPFFEIKAGKLQIRYRFWQNFFRIPLGFWQSFWILLKIKPHLILSFGGYLALPVAWTGYLLGIPVVTHEQTTVSGLANKLIARLAKKIFITFPSSAEYFPRDKVVLTGLPIREGIFKKGKSLFNNSQKTIYFTGGKQGAHVINLAIFDILPNLTEKFNVIHQCGSTTLYNDIKKADELKSTLGEKAKNYLVKEYFFEEEIGPVFNSADFVVTRGGGHTTYELMLLEKPAIVVPLPWASGQEQEKNAQMLVELGLAKILPQENLEKGKLWETILEFERNLKNYYLHSKVKLPLTEAADLIVQEIEKLFK